MAHAAVNRLLESCCFFVVVEFFCFFFKLLCFFGLSRSRQVPSHARSQSQPGVHTVSRRPFGPSVR